METPVGRALLRLTGVSLVAVVVVALVAPRRVNVVYDQSLVALSVVVFVVCALLVRVPRWLRGRWTPVAASAGVRGCDPPLRVVARV